jgi:hypothetical protein
MPVSPKDCHAAVAARVSEPLKMPTGKKFTKSSKVGGETLHKLCSLIISNQSRVRCESRVEVNQLELILKVIRESIEFSLSLRLC